MRPIHEFRQLAESGATSLDASAVLLAELRIGRGERDFRTATVGDDGGWAPPLAAAIAEPATQVALLRKSGRNPYDAFLFLGRASTCDVILRDATISKSHAVIEPGNPIWHVRDNRSHNGTHRNGVRLQQGERVALESGDLIVLGSYPLYFLHASELLRMLRTSMRPPRG